jgi:hypothetical protein
MRCMHATRFWIDFAQGERCTLAVGRLIRVLSNKAVRKPNRCPCSYKSTSTQKLASRRVDAPPTMSDPLKAKAVYGIFERCACLEVSEKYFYPQDRADISVKGPIGCQRQTLHSG